MRIEPASKMMKQVYFLPRNFMVSTNLPNLLLRGALLIGCSIPASYGALITYSTRGDVFAANPALLTETFESGITNGNSVTGCGPVINRNAPGPCFPPDTLIAGITYSTDTGDLALLAPGVAGNDSLVIGPERFSGTLTLAFQNTKAVALDIYPGPVAGNVLVAVFESSSGSPQPFLISAPADSAFFGVQSADSRISQITVASEAVISGELIDNVSIDAQTPEPPAATLSFAGMAAGLLIALRKYRACNFNC